MLTIPQYLGSQADKLGKRCHASRYDKQLVFKIILRLRIHRILITNTDWFSRQWLVDGVTHAMNADWYIHK